MTCDECKHDSKFHITLLSMNENVMDKQVCDYMGPDGYHGDDGPCYCVKEGKEID